MTTFVFDETVPTPPKLQACLGPDASTKFKSDYDLGKPVKLGSAQNYVLCVDGDEIEGYVTSVEATTYNSGFSFGGVQRNGWMTAEVIGATSMAVGNYAVAGTQVALGTAGAAKVKPGSPATFKWRCYRIITGAGAAGSKVLLYREA